MKDKILEAMQLFYNAIQGELIHRETPTASGFMVAEEDFDNHYIHLEERIREICNEETN